MTPLREEIGAERLELGNTGTAQIPGGPAEQSCLPTLGPLWSSLALTQASGSLAWTVAMCRCSIHVSGTGQEGAPPSFPFLPSAPRSPKGRILRKPPVQLWRPHSHELGTSRGAGFLSNSRGAQSTRRRSGAVARGTTHVLREGFTTH